MKVCLVAVGTLSSVQPFIAIGVELRKLGIEAVILCDEAFEDLCRTSGVGFQAIRPSRRHLLAMTGLNESEFAAAITTDWNFVLSRTVLPFVPQMLEDYRRAYAGASLAVTSNPAIVGRIAADAAGIRKMSIVVQPMALTTASEPPVYGGFEFLPRLRKRLGPNAVKPFISIGRFVARRLLKDFVEVRRRCGAPAFEGDESYDGALAADRVFALYSRELATIPYDAPPGIVQAGFTFFDRGLTGNDVSPELATFLRENAPPLIFTLGSLSVVLGSAFFEASARAADLLGRPAVLMVDDAQVDRYRYLASPTRFISGYAPHSRLFKQAAAVIHHGGIGTISQAMRAGVPQLSCPRYGDQFDNSYRLAMQGLGATLPLKDYTAEKAAEALSSLLQDDATARRSAEASERIAGENGAAVVAAHIRDWLEAAHPRKRVTQALRQYA